MNLRSNKTNKHVQRIKQEQPSPNPIHTQDKAKARVKVRSRLNINENIQSIQGTEPLDLTTQRPKVRSNVFGSTQAHKINCLELGSHCKQKKTDENGNQGNLPSSRINKTQCVWFISKIMFFVYCIYKFGWYGFLMSCILVVINISLNVTKFVIGIIKESSSKAKIYHHELFDIKCLNDLLKNNCLTNRTSRTKTLHQRKESVHINESDDTPKLFVLEIDSESNSMNLNTITDIVTYIISQANENDKVVLKLSSPGGSVSEFGAISSQLIRLRSACIPLTVCVDTVACSGGYMIACVANQILAAPFAYIGSIGVVAEMPNFSKLMHKYQIDYHTFTCGKFKRTVTPYSPINKQGKDKFLDNMNMIHNAFKEHILTFRKFNNDIFENKIATGDCWLACDAIELKLIDGICTADEYIYSHVNSSTILHISQKIKIKSLWKEMSFLKMGVTKSLMKTFEFYSKQLHGSNSDFGNMNLCK